ncbi:gliding motility protein GldN [Arcticibacter sp. MXS-1]|uniref:type IX secretion system ring protein PorN/GldN n=1 Tax=Arcticibacter sp. MXS-1 TaxID=3341726 RepID=UPI0035A948D0
MKRVYLTGLFTVFSLVLLAQKPDLNNSNTPVPVDAPKERPVDGYFKKNNIEEAKATPFAYIREADVMYSKRVWREIDLREKMNATYASPKARLIDIIMEGIKSGEMTAYDAVSTKDDPNGDAFSTVLKPDQVMSKFADSVLIPDFNANGEQVGSHMAVGEFNPDSVVKFQIKEDWIFDKNRSVFEPRIVGIAPMVKIKAAGQDLGEQPAFWIYYPNARHLFATKGVVTRSNDATGLSYDDIFLKRLFSSYIVKESNPEDLRIKDYAQGIDKLYESERVKKEILDYEHDLWSY